MKFEYFRERYAYCYLTVLLFGGVLTAICKYLGVSLPISFLSLTLLVSFPFLSLTYFSTLISIKVDIVFYIIGIIVLGTLLKALYYVGDVNQNSFVNTIYYLSTFLSISLCFGLNKVSSLKFIRYIYYSIAFLAVIGLVQFFFHEYLPYAFVELPVIKAELATTNNSREIEDIVLFSMNGLYNNPIVYGSTLLFPLVISSYNIYQNKRVIDVFIFSLSLIIIILLVSRVNIASAFLLVSFVFATRLSFKNIVYSTVILIAILFVLFLVFKDSPIIALIIDRFSGNDEWATASNDEHLSDYFKALSYISENILMGINVNDYVLMDIITDGAWFIFALDLSPVISFVLFGMILIMSYKFWLFTKESTCPNFSPLLIILAMGGWFNSFLVDKASLSIILVFYSLFYNVSVRGENV